MREIPEISLNVKHLLLSRVKSDQVILVNTAQPSEKPRLIQVYVTINDPFNGTFMCRNSKNVTACYDYECISEIMNSGKRKKVSKEINILIEKS